MLHEGIEKAAACHVTTRSLGLSRGELLHRALLKPHRVVPALADDPSIGLEAARCRLARLICGPSYRELTREYLAGDFDSEVSSYEVRRGAMGASRRQ